MTKRTFDRCFGEDKAEAFIQSPLNSSSLDPEDGAVGAATVQAENRGQKVTMRIVAGLVRLRYATGVRRLGRTHGVAMLPLRVPDFFGNRASPLVRSGRMQTNLRGKRTKACKLLSKRRGRVLQ